MTPEQVAAALAARTPGPPASALVPRTSGKWRGSIFDRFVSGINVVDSGCWEWTHTRRHGYGRVSLEGRTQAAHRVAYEWFVGPIPEGLDLDHLCRNPPCVNPEHLEPVTREENLRRQGAVALAVTVCPQGHELTDENTYWYRSKHRRCKTCRVAQRKASLARQRGVYNDRRRQDRAAARAERSLARRSEAENADRMRNLADPLWRVAEAARAHTDAECSCLAVNWTHDDDCALVTTEAALREALAALAATREEMP